MTKEQYESISLVELRGIAKNRGMRRISTLKKAELVEALLQKDKEENQQMPSGITPEEAVQAGSRKNAPAQEKTTGTAHADPAAGKAPQSAEGKSPAKEASRTAERKAFPEEALQSAERKASPEEALQSAERKASSEEASQTAERKAPLEETEDEGAGQRDRRTGQRVTGPAGSQRMTVTTGNVRAAGTVQGGRRQGTAGQGQRAGASGTIRQSQRPVGTGPAGQVRRTGTVGGTGQNRRADAAGSMGQNRRADAAGSMSQNRRADAAGSMRQNRRTDAAAGMGQNRRADTAGGMSQNRRADAPGSIRQNRRTEGSGWTQRETRTQGAGFGTDKTAAGAGRMNAQTASAMAGETPGAYLAGQADPGDRLQERQGGDHTAFTAERIPTSRMETLLRTDTAQIPVSEETAPAAQTQTDTQTTGADRADPAYRTGNADRDAYGHKDGFNAELDSGQMANGILDVMQDGFGFIRCANYMPGENDIYVAPSQIRRFGLKTGDIVVGNIRVKTQSEKFSALLYVKSVNGLPPDEAARRPNFEDMTPVFPNEKIHLERPGGSISMRIMDLMSPVGKGQRGMIVSPPKAGKTTLIKEVARSVKYNHPEIHLIVLLIDERPEEVTDIREAIEGPGAEVIYSTFDELPEHHKRVSEMVIERARRLVEHKKDVMILLDSITRLTRAYNLTEPSSGRTLSGGLDPAALHMPKRFFGAARNMREGGSLTILATALIDTGSKMDDIVFEEFKGTGNMELVLDRKLSERRIFPAIDIPRSGTRRDDLLLDPEALSAINMLRRSYNGLSAEQSVSQTLDLFSRTRSNEEFVNTVRKIQWTHS